MDITLIVIAIMFAIYFLPAILTILFGHYIEKNILKKKKCKYCKNYNTSNGHYTRSWNNYCNQAAGDNGCWCYDCCKVTFDRSVEEYNDGLPDWVSKAKD